MDYLQYKVFFSEPNIKKYVLNLIINGLPSILKVAFAWKAPLTF